MLGVSAAALSGRGLATGLVSPDRAAGFGSCFGAGWACCCLLLAAHPAPRPSGCFGSGSVASGAAEGVLPSPFEPAVPLSAK